MRDPARTATSTAVGLVVAGFGVLAVGWYGAARFDYVEGQIPYLISGGMAGLALIASGLTLTVVQQSRRDRMLIAAKLDELLVAQRRGAAHAGPTDAPLGVVVLGRTAFHAPQCHLVEGRGELPRTSLAEAAAQGLSPCRICTPAPAAATAVTARA